MNFIEILIEIEMSEVDWGIYLKSNYKILHK